MSHATIPETTEQAETQFLDALMGKGNGSGEVVGVRAVRKHHSRFPVADIVIDPTENYRWGSVDAMKADLAAKELTLDNGDVRSGYAMLRESIRVLGVEDPIGLVQREDGYHVVYGFTRATAAREVGLETVPAYVYQNITEAEAQLLQARENSPQLKRSVNWLSEHEMFNEMVVRLINRLNASKAEGSALPSSFPQSKARAEEVVAKILGRGVQSMRNRTHYLRHLDPRVKMLAREGRITCTAAIEFYSGDANNLYPASYITAIMAALAGADGAYPDRITPQRVREAKRAVMLRGDGPTDTGEKRQRSVVGQRSKAPGACRDSAPGVIRDTAILIAARLLLAEKLNLTSTDSQVAELTRSVEWAMIQGMGMGCGEVAHPPVLLAARPDTAKAAPANEWDGEDDADEEGDMDANLARMQQRHEESAERYATAVFIQAFVRNAMDRAGVKNFENWIAGAYKEPGTTRTTSHRSIHNAAVNRALVDPGLTLLARAKLAWTDVRKLMPKTAPAGRASAVA